MAEGDRTSLTSLDAAVVTVAPSPPARGMAPSPPRPPAGGTGSSARSG
ncbi:MAG: hypothetical protein M0Z82_04965 [Actinomycetota bacterium]|nr:hypothetical protein [Actinomycetota bacterium]